MNIEVKEITPELATEMMKMNTGNRPIRQSRVTELARIMKAGEWRLNGEAIKQNGSRLLDGQHRLLGVIESGVTIQSLVVSDLPTDVFGTLDGGTARNHADFLAVLGEKSCNVLAAGLRLVNMYETGRMRRRVVYSNTEMGGLVKQHPDIRQSVLFCDSRRRLGNVTTFVACHYLFAQKDRAAADAFINQLVTGTDLPANDAVYLLRERILADRLAKEKLSKVYVMALVIKAWNFRRQGKSIKTLQFRETGDTPESFPVVI